MSDQARNPEQIEDDILATQRRIDREIESIRAQFQPAAIIARLIGEEEAGRRGGNANGPLGPASLRAALIGAGITWLAQNAFVALNSPEVRKTARNAASRARKTAREASESGAEAGEAAVEAISDAVDQIRAGSLRGLEWVKNNPIPTSLAGFAAGAAIAAMLSATLEDSVRGSAKSAGQDGGTAAKGAGRTRKPPARKTSSTAKRTGKASRTARAGQTAKAAAGKPAATAKPDQRHAS